MLGQFCKSLLTSSVNNFQACRTFSTAQRLLQIRKLTRLNIVDNSELGRRAQLAGKPARVIHVYKKNSVGTLGDKVLMTILGQKKRGYIVGVVKKQKSFIPKFDTNNVVLIDDNGTPTGTRIRVPIPSMLRGKRNKHVEFTKVLALATKFV